MDLFNFLKETEGLESSLKFAITHGLLPDKTPRKCIKCGKPNGLRWMKNSRVVNVPYMFVCARKDCRSTISITKNTLFDHLSFSLSQALRLIYFWLLKISIRECCNQLQLSETTVVDWFHFFQEVCAFVIINYTKAIGGPGHTVEICEYHLQTKGESYDVWLFTGVDRNTGQKFAIHVEDLDCETLWPVLKNYILPGTIVVTKRCRDFTKKESSGESESLSFVPASKYPRYEHHYHLDQMWNALKYYVDHEMPPNQQSCKELSAYQFLYFNRDGFCNKPASELLLPFLTDIKQVFPGFEKLKLVEYKTVKLH